MPELSCSFASHFTTQCGVSSRYSGSSRECVALSTCTGNVKPHLRKLKVTQTCVSSEKDPILARVGLFGEDGSGFTICPKHRAELGLKFRPSRKSQHTIHGSRSQKPDRGMNLQVVKDVYARWRTIVPVGSGKKHPILSHASFRGNALRRLRLSLGICRTCRSEHRSAIEGTIYFNPESSGGHEIPREEPGECAAQHASNVQQDVFQEEARSEVRLLRSTKS